MKLIDDERFNFQVSSGRSATIIFLMPSFSFLMHFRPMFFNVSCLLFAYSKKSWRCTPLHTTLFEIIFSPHLNWNGRTQSGNLLRFAMNNLIDIKIQKLILKMCSSSVHKTNVCIDIAISKSHYNKSKFRFFVQQCGFCGYF